MSRNSILEDLEKEQLKTDVPFFEVGDTVRVHIRIIEGEKERVQQFAGVVIARKGTGIGESFSLYRVAYGCAMERVFLLNSPRIGKIEILKKGRVRRSKLYYILGKSGKKAKIQERIMKKVGSAALAAE